MTWTTILCKFGTVLFEASIINPPHATPSFLIVAHFEPHPLRGAPVLFRLACAAGHVPGAAIGPRSAGGVCLGARSGSMHPWKTRFGLLGDLQRCTCNANRTYYFYNMHGALFQQHTRFQMQRYVQGTTRRGARMQRAVEGRLSQQNFCVVPLKSDALRATPPYFGCAIDCGRPELHILHPPP